jgi:CBS domain-containing protein
MKAKDIMRRPAIVINEDRTLEDAAMVMLEEDVGGLPVVDSSGKLVGIITESDFSAKEHGIPFSRIYAPQLFGEWMSKEGVEKAYLAARSNIVKKIMTKSVVTASEEDSLEEVITKMLENRVHRIPVIREGVPVGMISRHDLLKLVARHIKQSK